jgi:hypothetical protein
MDGASGTWLAAPADRASDAPAVLKRCARCRPPRLSSSQADCCELCVVLWRCGAAERGPQKKFFHACARTRSLRSAAGTGAIH